MQKLKTQKGITLIALIITIIVMLILVGVSVTVALNGGLFSTAQTATDKTQLELDKEQLLSAVIGAINNKGKVDFDVLDNNLPEGFTKTEEHTYTSKAGNTFVVSENAAITLVGQTEGGSGETGGDTGDDVTGSWQQEGNEIKYVTASGEVITTLKIGDKVAYDETKAGTVTVSTANMEWRVLGVNGEGQVELISTIPTTETVTLSGKDGYVNAVTLLDTGCSAYGQGEGAAGVRALTAEDINKLAGYDPVTDYSEYGTKYTYKYYDGSVYGIASASITDANKDNATGWAYSGFKEIYSPDWTISSSDVGPYELENTYYYYTVANQVSITDPVDMATLITNGEGGSSNVTQWLASRSVVCQKDWACFNVRYVNSGYVGNWSHLLAYDGTEGSRSFAVRPVVSLESTIQLSDADSDGVYDID